MKQIENIEKITSIYNTWKASDVAFLKTLEMSTNRLLISFYCQLRSDVNGWPDLSKDFFEVSMVFKNIYNLKLDFNNGQLQQILGFDIIDISDNNMENINFQIEDYENGRISFNCEEIEVVKVFPLIKLHLI
ncbi:hypothetical protein BB021_08260 [Elizabethkingia ursingii]|uniref:Uncharacterized protein n=2 Tax=Elizabethkingia ursingii TaxID=1756150 RepID=A0ABX3N7W7_9FLAO|nr:hypothetical protein BB021_08260 [Elizabethkingia ursingii]